MKHKKRVLRNIASLLAVSLLLTALGTPLSQAKQLYDLTHPTIANSEPQIEEVPEQEPEIVGELTDRREENVKHFLMDDGSFAAAVYPEPVHYEENGELVEIDNTLQDAPADKADSEDVDGVSNAKNDFKVKFAKKGDSKKLVTLQKKNIKLSWQIVGANGIKLQKQEKITLSSEDLDDKTQVQNQSDSITYENILTGTDVRYTIASKTIKEDIIIKDKTAPHEFQILFDAKKLNMALNEDNSITVIDPSSPEEPVFQIDAPYAYDAHQEATQDIKVTLEEQKKGYLLTMNISEEWLSDPQRAYPITLDPTVQTDISRSSILDAVMYSNTPNTADDSSMLNRAGVFRSNAGGANKTSRSLIRFDLPTLPISSRVVFAQMGLHSAPRSPSSPVNYDYWPVAGVDDNGKTRYAVRKNIGVYRVTSSWTASSATWNNMAGKYNSKQGDFVKYQYDNNDHTKTWMWDITSIVQDWYEGSANYGIMLKEVDETVDVVNKGHSDVYFLSSDTTDTNARPTAYIQYLDTKGLESYWSYTTQDLGEAGTAYVHDMTGNLVFVRQDTFGVGSRMPAAISHIYNSNDRETDIGFGNGFRLNISQRVKQITESSSDSLEKNMAKLGYKWKYTDEDGTDIYFFESKDEGKKLIDETGKGYILTSDSSTQQTITDKDNNKLVFKNGQLSEIRDTNGNVITITYSGDKPVKVTDPAGKVTDLIYTNGRLTRIEDDTGRNVSFTYDTRSGVTQNNLVGINHTDYGHTQIEYSSSYKGLLMGLRDAYSLYTVRYDRSAAPFHRITAIREYSTSSYNTTTKTLTTSESNLGQKMSVSYGKSQTVYRTSGSNEIYGDSDDWLTTYRFDRYGKTMSTSTTSLDGKTHYGAQQYEYTPNIRKTATATPSLAQAYQINKIKDSSAVGKNVVNLLENHSFEDTSDTFTDSKGWGTSDWHGSTDKSTYEFRFDLSGYAGNRMAKLIVNKPAQNLLAIRQDITDKVKPNTTYTASGYFNVLNIEDGHVMISVVVSHSDGTKSYHESENIYTDTLGWQRLSATFTLPSSYESVVLYAGMREASGTTYMDAFQLEEGEVANRYNYVENGGFEDGTRGWTGLNTTSSDKVASSPTFEGSGAYKFQGDPQKQKWQKQVIPINSVDSVGKTYIISGWINGYTSPKHDDENIRTSIAVALGNGSSLDWTSGVDYTYNMDGWQFGSRAITIPDNGKLYSSIEIYLCYYWDVGSVAYDNIQVIQESYNSYTYDSKGNVITAAQNAEQKSTLDYDGDNQLIKQTDPNGYDYSYEYQKNTHNLQHAITPEGVITGYTYDQYGNPISVQTGRYLLDFFRFENDLTGDISTVWKMTGNNISYIIAKHGQGLDLNGSSSYATLSNMPLLDNFSISLFILPDSTNSGQTFLHWKNGTSTNLSIGFTDKISLKVNGTTTSGGSKKTGWQHIVMTASKVTSTTMQVQLYQNGERIISKRVNGVPGGYGTWTFGCNVNGTTRNEYFNGRLDSVAFFDGILSKDEIDEINNMAVQPFKDKYKPRALKSTAEYSSDGRFMTKITDHFGSSNTYTYDEDNGFLTSVKDANGVTTNYTYNGASRLQKVSATADGKTYSNQYTYNGKRQLDGIIHNGTAYQFQYTPFGQIAKTMVGNQTLMTNTYESNNGKLKESQYGNGDRLSYLYSKENRLEKLYRGSNLYTWIYDANGNVFKHSDVPTGLIYQYEYDANGRLNGYWVKGNPYEMHARYQYDANNNIERADHLINGNHKLSSQYYFDKDNRGTLSMLGNSEVRNRYDSLGRLKSTEYRGQASGPLLKTEYVYRDMTYYTTNKIDSVKYTKNGSTTATANYQFISNGYISGYYTSDMPGIITYAYDKMGQLIRENNPHSKKTTVYEYDSAGNILRKKEYAYTTAATSLLGTPTDTIEYSYGDSNWKDLMTQYDGWNITYDEIGNPTIYKKNMWCTWEGRLLTSFSGGPYNETTYTYNADGIRTKKATGGVVTTYILDGNQIVREQASDGSFDFYYDSNGVMQKMVFYKQSTGTTGGVTYFPRYNVQGDVIALLDTNGNVVVRYAYDAWGKVLKVVDGNGSAITDQYHVGNQNPFRYRGYYYDTESQFYYLQSRYYDPEVGRFINADTIDVLAASPMALTDKNLFAYCDNNPVVRADYNGEFWDIIFDIASIAISIIDVATHPTSGVAWAGLAADVVCAAVPGATGGGAIVKAVTKADDVVDAVKTVNKVDNVIDTTNTAKAVDFYIAPMGDAIPATRKGFAKNLSMLDNRGGKYYGIDSRGPVRIRTEQHLPTLGYTGPYNPYHCEPHFHIDRRLNGWSGGFRKTYTGLMRWLR